MRRRLVGWLLGRASQEDPWWGPSYPWYECWATLCARYGVPDGVDELHTVTQDPATQQWTETWVRARRWRVGRTVLHQPITQTTNRPHWDVGQHLDVVPVPPTAVRAVRPGAILATCWLLAGWGSTATFQYYWRWRIYEDRSVPIWLVVLCYVPYLISCGRQWMSSPHRRGPRSEEAPTDG